MKQHIYEFRTEGRKLSCNCGWERTLKTADEKLIAKTFAQHRLDASKG